MSGKEGLRGRIRGEEGERRRTRGKKETKKHTHTLYTHLHTPICTQQPPHMQRVSSHIPLCDGLCRKLSVLGRKAIIIIVAALL